jgi:hypothetical protein
MKKQEFFDKIDTIRQVLMQAKREGYDDTTKAIGLLQELRTDAELILDDERTEDTSARAYGHGC